MRKCVQGRWRVRVRGRVRLTLTPNKQTTGDIMVVKRVSRENTEMYLVLRSR